MNKRNNLTFTEKYTGIGVDLWTAAVHVAILIAFVIIIAMAMFSSVVAGEPEIAERLSARLYVEIEKNLDNGEMDFAIKRAQLLESIEKARATRAAAEALELQTVQLKRIDNLFKSTPAFVRGFEAAATKFGNLKEGSDDWYAVQIVKLVAKATENPLATDEVVKALKLEAK